MNPEHNSKIFKGELNPHINNITPDILDSSNKNELIIPVIKEFLTVKKEIIETGQISIKKKSKKRLRKLIYLL